MKKKSYSVASGKKVKPKPQTYDCMCWFFDGLGLGSDCTGNSCVNKKGKKK